VAVTLPPGRYNIVAARLMMLERILSGNTVEPSLPGMVPSLSPEIWYRTVIGEKWREKRLKERFDLSPFIRMLEEEGVYEPGQVAAKEQQEKAQAAAAAAAEASNSSTSSSSTSTSTLSYPDWKKQTILSHLHSKAEKDVGISELTHLPIDLTYLDFLTTLIENQMLKNLSIDVAAIVRDYLNHALRLIEQMGEPLPERWRPDVTNEDFNRLLAADSQGIEHGREAQVRAVKLLLLFMRNLIRKEFVPVKELFWEVREISVRFLWIREVREFRAEVFGKGS
jgi:hypothetical protein